MSVILLIEDDQDQRGLLRFYLQKRGHEVLEAADGITGLALARERRPDLALIDWMLPGMDGRAVCTALKAEAATCKIPVILCTAAFDSGSKARPAGEADDFLAKPYDWDAIDAMVLRWLPKS